MQAGDDSTARLTRDPVCGRELTLAQTLLVSEHDGELHPFCSERCRMRFALHPERFASAAASARRAE